MVSNPVVGHGEPMLQALLPQGRELLITAAGHADLERALEDLLATQHAHDPHGGLPRDPLDPGTGIQARIVLVEQALAQAQVIPSDAGSFTRAAVGTTIDVDDGRRKSRYALTVLAPPDDPEGAIAVSVTSPVGLALLGSAVDETVTVELPDGRSRRLQVLRITASP